MGFRATRKLYKLVFEPGSDIEGLEIIARGTTLGERRDYLAKFPEDAKGLEKLEYEAAFFIDHVNDWNLEDEDGTPMPIAVESLSELLDIPWIQAIINSWIERSNLSLKVPEDLKKESKTGGSTETTRPMEESLPMEPLP
jgi:hypothetical protein